MLTSPWRSNTAFSAPIASAMQAIAGAGLTERDKGGGGGEQGATSASTVERQR